MLLFKNILFIIFIPGTAIILIPYWIIGGHPLLLLKEWSFIQYTALAPMLLGFFAFGQCIWLFATAGRGTPFPLDPPKILIVRGLYQYVRNPMYLGALLIIVGEAALFIMWRLIFYAGVIFICFHLFVVFYEEVNLRRKFGESYLRYCSSVHRWLPGKKYDPSA